MAQLVVDFKFMFLLANGNLRGGTVLLPSAGHSMTIRTPGHRALVGLTRAEVTFDGRGKHEIAYSIDKANRYFRAGDAYLVRLEDIFGGPVNVQRKYLMDDPAPAELNARVILPGGLFRDLEPFNLPDTKRVRWNAGGAKLQRLTDQLRFEGPAERECTMTITHVGPNGVEVIEIPLNEINGEFLVEFINDDPDCEGPEDPPAVWTLDEYRHLFALTEIAPADFAAAVPKGVYKPTAGIVVDCLPICGGAQCDPDPKP